MGLGKQNWVAAIGGASVRRWPLLNSVGRGLGTFASIAMKSSVKNEATTPYMCNHRHRHLLDLPGFVDAHVTRLGQADMLLGLDDPGEAVQRSRDR